MENEYSVLRYSIFNDNEINVFYRFLAQVYERHLSIKGRFHREEVLYELERMWKGTKDFIHYYRSFAENYFSIHERLKDKNIKSPLLSFYKKVWELEEEIVSKYLNRKHARGGI